VTGGPFHHRDTETQRGVSPEVNTVSGKILDAAFAVHSKLGPGLLESIYEICLEYELQRRGLKVQRQVRVPVVYDEVQLDAGLTLDLLVEDLVIVELKAIEGLLPIHQAQLLTYLKLTGIRLGLLINFNVSYLKNGIKRLIL
jgi:GxxExxY protein